MSPERALSAIEDAFARRAFEEAFQIASPWAEGGNGWAEACIASLDQCGLGIERNLAKAICLFLRAGEHGVPGAWYSLGVIYQVGGDELTPDLEISERYFKRARDLGYFPGQPFLQAGPPTNATS